MVLEQIFGIFSSIGAKASLLVLGFKLVFLLFIVQFLRNRFGHGPIITVGTLILGYILLFTNYFFVFGPIMFIYLFILFGFTSILFDLAIAKPWKSSPGGNPNDSRSMRTKRGLYG